MRLSRTPLRITLGGGGSDLTPGGICVNAAISLHTYVATNPIHEDAYVLRYSDIERVSTTAEIKHRLIRMCCEVANVGPGVEITSISDMPSGAGLGSSATFTVGLLRVLLPDTALSTLVNLATAIDVGLQDQYAATYGGLRVWHFDSTVRSEVLEVPSWFDQLALYDTGLRRDAYETLRANRRPDPAVLYTQAADMVDALCDPEKFAACLNDQWTAKLRAAPTDIHLVIDRQINSLLHAGAHGAKLVGAGDGGMILTYGKPESDLRRVDFTVDHDGTVLL